MPSEIRRNGGGHPGGTFIRGGCKIIREIGALDEVAKTPISQIISVVRCPIILGKTLYSTTERQIRRQICTFSKPEEK